MRLTLDDVQGVRQDGVFGLRFKGARTIAAVDTNGAAARQGVQVGDVLVAVDGKKLTDSVS